MGRLLRPLKRFKRLVVNRRGDGVHSPYAFRIINKIINCRYPFYCFDEIRQSLPQIDANTKRRLRLHEVSFRLVHHHGQGDVLLYTQPDSLLVTYLRHLRPCGGLVLGRQSEQVINPTSARIVIVESLSSGAVTSALQALQNRLEMHEEMILIVYPQSSTVLQFLEELKQIHPPRASFDLIDLELWVWRSGLTPGHYKGIIK